MPAGPTVCVCVCEYVFLLQCLQPKSIRNIVSCLTNCFALTPPFKISNFSSRHTHTRVGTSNFVVASVDNNASHAGTSLQPRSDNERQPFVDLYNPADSASPTPSCLETYELKLSSAPRLSPLLHPGYCLFLEVGEGGGGGCLCTKICILQHLSQQHQHAAVCVTTATGDCHRSRARAELMNLWWVCSPVPLGKAEAPSDLARCLIKLKAIFKPNCPRLLGGRSSEEGDAVVTRFAERALHFNSTKKKKNKEQNKTPTPRDEAISPTRSSVVVLRYNLLPFDRSPLACVRCVSHRALQKKRKQKEKSA